MVNAGVVHQVRIERQNLLELLFLLFDKPRTMSDYRIIALEYNRVDHRPVPPVLASLAHGCSLRNVLAGKVKYQTPLLRQPVPFQIHGFHAKPPLRLLDQGDDAARRVIGRCGVG